MLHYWATNAPVTNAVTQSDIDIRSAVDIYQWLREVCTTKLLQSPIILGGQGEIVQIDESLFRHKPKVHCITVTVLKFVNIILY